jgi:hypothetical protein
LGIVDDPSPGKEIFMETYQIVIVVGSLRTEAFIHAKDGLFDEFGNIGMDSKQFLQKWMDRYIAWVKKHVD